jgi:hypothetical protein
MHCEGYDISEYVSQSYILQEPIMKYNVFDWLIEPSRDHSIYSRIIPACTRCQQRR